MGVNKHGSINRSMGRCTVSSKTIKRSLAKQLGCQWVLGDPPLCVDPRTQFTQSRRLCSRGDRLQLLLEGWIVAQWQAMREQR